MAQQQLADVTIYISGHPSSSVRQLDLTALINVNKGESHLAFSSLKVYVTLNNIKIKFNNSQRGYPAPFNSRFIFLIVLIMSSSASATKNCTKKKGSEKRR